MRRGLPVPVGFLAIGLPQHPEEHRPEPLGVGNWIIGVPLTRRSGRTLEVREHEDVEQFGAWSGTVNAEGSRGSGEAFRGMVCRRTRALSILRGLDSEVTEDMINDRSHSKAPRAFDP